MAGTTETPEKKKFIDTLAEFIQRNRRKFLIVFGIIVVVIAGLVAYAEVRKSTIEKSALQVEQIERDFSAYLSIEADKVEEKKAKEEELVKKAEDLVSRFSGTHAADRARMILGNLAFQKKDWEKAASVWTSLADASPKSYLAPIALLNASAAWEENGKNDQALEALGRIVSSYRQVFPETPRALFSLGRLSEKVEASDKAAGYYNELIDQHPGSSWTKLARDRIIYLQVRNKIPK